MTPRLLLAQLRKFARRLAQEVLRGAAKRAGLDVVERNMYSPVPDVPPADSAIWVGGSPTPGLDVDTLAHLEYLERTLSPYLSEFHPPLEPSGGPGAFYLRNGYYGPVDAEVLYAIIRSHRPRSILELGAGYSTLISAIACTRNAREGIPARLVAIDPEPRLHLDVGPTELIVFQRLSASELPLERYLELQSGDILFVDTTHTVKLESEVNFLILQVLPRLRPGVLVHFHDIFIPYEYPREWFARGTYLTEQYLLQAFLCGNPRWEVIFAAHALARQHSERLARAIPSLLAVQHAPSGFWVRRRP